MDTHTFIEEFRFSGPNGWATDEDIAKIQSFLDIGPDTARLWNFCGDAIQMVDTEPSRYSLKDSKICYETAIARFPNDPEAYESLGFWYDIQNEFALAETCFRNAMERSNSDSPVLGLARVLAQMGRRSEALAALTQCSSPELPEAISLTEEIRNGNWPPEH